MDKVRDLMIASGIPLARYNDKLDPDRQITAEESVAATIFGFQRNQIQEDDAEGRDNTLTEEDCQTLSQSVLLLVLHEFRPDLMEQDTDK